MAETERRLVTREKIMFSAARVFVDRGYVGAGLAEIIAGTGMTRGAFYFHFTSKAELAKEIIERQHETFVPLQDSAGAIGLQGLDAVKYVMDHLSQEMRDDVIARAAVRLAQEVDLIDAKIRSPFTDWTECFGYNLRQAQLLGQMRTDLDTVTYAGVLVGMFLGVESYANNPTNTIASIQPRIINPSHYSLNAMWEVVLRGLMSRERR